LKHVLDGVKLGQYAVKKVAIGNNHPWLVRMLREVHLLERLRHPNIVSYKHSWLEYHRFSAFGPKVPCLYILMECANGGNLEEYMTVNQQQQSKKKKKKMTSKELKMERIRRQYKEQEDFENETEVTTWTDKRLLTMTEIWSLLLNIVQGLNHLHSQNIVHRDLKPPNLLLQYDDNRLEHTGM
jgi:serine/threonine protein kinase